MVSSTALPPLVVGPLGAVNGFFVGGPVVGAPVTFLGMVVIATALPL